MSAPHPAAVQVLVVDDDEGLLILMAEALRDAGYTVATAQSGAAALEWLTHNDADLLVLDLKMRDVGGAALVKRLKREEKPLPFIVVTGQGDEKVAVEVMKQGALDYVMKYSGLVDLLPDVVRRALGTIAQQRALDRAQADLRESEARLSAALRATNDGVWEWRISDDYFYFSPRWKANLGFKPDEIPDEREQWASRIHPDDRARLRTAIDGFLTGDKSVFSIEYRLKPKEGAYRWFLLRAFLQRSSSGEPVRMTSADSDITERKQLEKEILRISDREQWRIGQELHDGLGQQLTALELMCQGLVTDLRTDRPEHASQLAMMGQYLRDAIAQTRSLAHGLTPFRLDADGLQAALAELVRRTQSLGRVQCEFFCPDPVRIQDSDAAGHLFRIAQEALNNSVKHSGAKHVSIGLRQSGGTIVLEVTDDGKGLPKVQRRRDGIGLQVMQHRANSIGAELKVESRGASQGLSVICTYKTSQEGVSHE